MATFLMLLKDTPQTCCLSNVQSAKATFDLLAKLPEINQKYGIKILASCTVISGEHVSTMIVEAPSLEAVQRASMEPEYFALNKFGTLEIKPALSSEETVKLMQQQFQQQRTPITA
jgi:hypothetical protein